MDKLFIVAISNHFTNRKSKNGFLTTDRNYDVKNNSKGIIFGKPKTPFQKALVNYLPRHELPILR